MSAHPNILRARASLARNYRDFPFDLSDKPGLASACVTRTAWALALSGADSGFSLIRMSDISDNRRRELVENDAISEDMLRTWDTSAVLLNEDEALSIMLCDSDHLVIRARADDPVQAAERCLKMDDALSRHVTFAWDEQLGYLTSRPDRVGTGLKLSVLLFLPVLSMQPSPEDLLPPGFDDCTVSFLHDNLNLSIVELSLKATLGAAELGMAETLYRKALELSDVEDQLRSDPEVHSLSLVEDEAYKSFGTLKYGRLFNYRHFMGHWSSVRLGACMKLIPVPLDVLDAMPGEMGDAHLCAWAEKPLEGEELLSTRARRIQELLSTVQL